MRIQPNAFVRHIQGMLPGLFAAPATPQRTKPQPQPAPVQHGSAGTAKVSYQHVKILSIRQPWAWLIVNGYKDIENRTWDTDHRGLILIHAGQALDPDFAGLCEALTEDGVELPATFPRGGIVGSAEIVDVITKKRNRRDEWFQGPYGFVLDNAKELPFVPMKGQLKLFTGSYTSN